MASSSEGGSESAEWGVQTIQSAQANAWITARGLDSRDFAVMIEYRSRDAAAGPHLVKVLERSPFDP